MLKGLHFSYFLPRGRGDGGVGGSDLGGHFSALVADLAWWSFRPWQSFSVRDTVFFEYAER